MVNHINSSPNHIRLLIAPRKTNGTTRVRPNAAVAIDPGSAPMTTPAAIQAVFEVIMVAEMMVVEMMLAVVMLRTEQTIRPLRRLRRGGRRYYRPSIRWPASTWLLMRSTELFSR